MNDWKVDVPEGRSGDWRVERFVVSERDAEMERLRSLFSFGGRGVPAGSYTRLMRGSCVVMSDTPDEVRDHRFAVRVAKGRCLVAGLGLGMVARMMLLKPEVSHLTIIEQSPDVIGLVGPWLTGRFGARVNIVQADALAWSPPKSAHYDAAWFDIWDHITADNLPEMKALHRRFARRASWKGSWARELCERHR